MSTTPIGIDLGTTYSAVAAMNEQGEVQLLPNAEGDYITPSVVCFEGDNIVVGAVAKQARVDMPGATAEFVKRSMGSTWRFHFAGKEFTPIEISAITLKKLKLDAEAALGEPITEAVITCPAYFSTDQRDATEKAAQIAGLTVRALVNEPTAAAIAFGMGGDRIGNALVFDLGGGTFDVTVVNFGTGNQIEVLASDGDAELGGKDFDDAIMQLVMTEVQREHGTDISSDMEALAELRQKAEKAKHDLSARESTTIIQNIDGRKIRVQLSREAFTAAIQPLIEGMRLTIRTVLSDCGLTKDDIADVLLVGGSTRVPVVRRMVSEFFGREPNTTIHPDEAVARGAALYAAKLLASQIENGLPPEVRERAKALPAVQDIAPHSIGITVVAKDKEDPNAQVNSIILPRGAALPASVAERYVTVQDGQTAVKIEVNEGEEEDLAFVKELGSFALAFPAARPAGSPIDVQVGLDLSGIIRVRAMEVESGQQQEITIDYPMNLNQDQVRERAAWLSRQTVG